MANRDNANGFTFVRCLEGEAVILEATVGALAVKKGDAVNMESGLLVLSVAADTKVYGIMAADAAAEAQGKFYPAIPSYVFEVQVSSSLDFVAATHTNFACPLEGTTGIMELNLTAEGTMQFILWKLADATVHNVTNIVAAHANVYCTIYQSQFLGIPGATQVHV